MSVSRTKEGISSRATTERETMISYNTHNWLIYVRKPLFSFGNLLLWKTNTIFALFSNGKYIYE